MEIKVRISDGSMVSDWQQIQYTYTDVTTSNGFYTVKQAFLNDEYWGAFFATGNSQFINKLVEQLIYWNERNDMDLFLVAVTAKWSLASVAQSDQTVREILEDPGRKDPTEVKQQIGDLLTAWDPTIFKDQAKEIIRQQRALGRWH